MAAAMMSSSTWSRAISTGTSAPNCLQTVMTLAVSAGIRADERDQHVRVDLRQRIAEVVELADPVAAHGDGRRCAGCC